MEAALDARESGREGTGEPLIRPRKAGLLCRFSLLWIESVPFDRSLPKERLRQELSPRRGSMSLSSPLKDGIIDP
jgi:hypothetical protein